MSEHNDYRNSGAESPKDRISADDIGEISEDGSETQSDAWLSIQLQVEKDRPELLQGLEQWLELGLISSSQLRKIARNCLSCPLPVRSVSASQVLSVTAKNNILEHQAKATKTNPLAQFVRSFLDELSIRWLLFLGIFLVVISSGVLAASQWQNFPNYGQYLVLLVYTLGFWGIGFWTGKQNSLRLTSQTLKAIAILLIPINFWAISHLSLGQSLGEKMVISIAAIVLMATGYVSYRGRKNYLWLLLFYLLGYLHFGWQINNFSLLAIYGGIGTITCYKLWLPRGKYVTEWLYVLTAWSLLLMRQLIIAPNSVANFCLAIAIFLYLTDSIYLDRISQIKVVALKHKSAAITSSFLLRLAKVIGIILFISIWLISVNAGLFAPSFFWQTVGISALAIHLFGQRLHLYGNKRDLTAIFLIGLQTLYVCKELIPDSFRTEALELSIAISKTTYLPESVLGVTLFPYAILFVFVASWLYRRQKRSLALHSEYLTLILAISLTCLSFSNPVWRSLNLLLSTLTLGYIFRIRRPLRINLFYLTHLLGSITLVNAIAVIFTDLNQFWWGLVFTVLATLEWSICLTRSKQRFSSVAAQINRSFWYAGWFFSAISYAYFSQADVRWSLIWLIEPIMLTAIARSTRKIEQRRLATVGSCLGLVAAQLLVFHHFEIRTIALSIAMGLMIVNAFHLRRLAVTIVHLGFALGLFASLISLIIGDGDGYAHWLSISAIAILLLYRFRLYLLEIFETPRSDYISQRNAFGILGVGREAKNFKLIGKYVRAADYWAIALFASEIAVVSVTYFFLPSVKINSYLWHYLLTTSILMAAVLWRYRSQPNNLVLYALAWLVGIWTAGLLRLFTSSNLAFAVGNIILGLLAIVAVVFISQSRTPWAKLNLASIPLIYAGLGILWRVSLFNAYTGWLILSAAFIALNTQQQNSRIDRGIKYLSFAGISWGIYELVIYQMQLSTGGSSADALTILSLVAAAIACCYRFTAWRYRQKNTPTIFNLKLSQIILIAHIHWATSSILKILAAGIAIESNSARLTLVSIATSFCLGAYALIQGRDRQIDSISTTQDRDWWVYVGLVEIAATLVYSRLIISKLSLFDPWRIVFTCAIALLIYQIPWHNFGWQRTPWQRTALIAPAVMVVVTAETISYFSLSITALFYLRIAYAQSNIRWSYLSLGLLGWLGIRQAIALTLEPISIVGIFCFSLLYIAQFDPYLQSQRRQRHYLRLFGSSIFCLITLIDESGITAGAIAAAAILLGLGLRIRAFLFTGTITLILTVVHQLIILVFTYSFLKWVVGLFAGISSIVVAAGFENQRKRISGRFQSYSNKLQDWQ